MLSLILLVIGGYGVYRFIKWAWFSSSPYEKSVDNDTSKSYNVDDSAKSTPYTSIPTSHNNYIPIPIVIPSSSRNEAEPSSKVSSSRYNSSDSLSSSGSTYSSPTSSTESSWGWGSSSGSDTSYSGGGGDSGGGGASDSF